jgi:predicted RNase H-like HicB family nuclease
MAIFYFAGFVPVEDGGFHITIPDVPRCFTQADTLEDGMEAAAEVLAMCLRDMVENNRPTPEPSPLPKVREMVAEELRELECEEEGGEILYPLIAAPSLDMAPVKISISMPKAVLQEVDAKAKAAGFTRSGFLAHAAQAYQQEHF